MAHAPSWHRISAAGRFFPLMPASNSAAGRGRQTISKLLIYMLLSRLKGRFSDALSVFVQVFTRPTSVPRRIILWRRQRPQAARNFGGAFDWFVALCSSMCGPNLRELEMRARTELLRVMESRRNANHMREPPAIRDPDRFLIVSSSRIGAFPAAGR